MLSVATAQQEQFESDKPKPQMDDEIILDVVVDQGDYFHQHPWWRTKKAVLTEYQMVEYGFVEKQDFEVLDKNVQNLKISLACRMEGYESDSCPVRSGCEGCMARA